MPVLASHSRCPAAFCSASGGWKALAITAGKGPAGPTAWCGWWYWAYSGWGVVENTGRAARGKRLPWGPCWAGACALGDSGPRASNASMQNGDLSAVLVPAIGGIRSAVCESNRRQSSTSPPLGSSQLSSGLRETFRLAGHAHFSPAATPPASWGEDSLPPSFSHLLSIHDAPVWFGGRQRLCKRLIIAEIRIYSHVDAVNLNSEKHAAWQAKLQCNFNHMGQMARTVAVEKSKEN